MAKYKNFGELNEKDYVFSTELINSSIKQDCVGSIYNRFIVDKKEMSSSNGKIILTLVYDKSTFLKQWTPEKDEKLTAIVLPVDSIENKKILDTKKTGDNKVNCIIFSTNIESICETISEIAITLNNRINELDSIIKDMKRDLVNISTNFSIRKGMNPDYIMQNVKPQYQEVVTTEAVYV